MILRYSRLGAGPHHQPNERDSDDFFGWLAHCDVGVHHFVTPSTQRPDNYAPIAF
jgi:hypothetical protein